MNIKKEWVYPHFFPSLQNFATRTTNYKTIIIIFYAIPPIYSRDLVEISHNSPRSPTETLDTIVVPFAGYTYKLFTVVGL